MTALSIGVLFPRPKLAGFDWAMLLTAWRFRPFIRIAGSLLEVVVEFLDGGQPRGKKTMLQRRVSALILFAVVPLSACWSAASFAADKDATKDGGKAAGILIDRKEDWITVKADGEDEPVKYLIDASDKKLQEAFKSIFNASRVQLTYKTDGDSRRLVSIKKQILKASGTVTGNVVKVYNNFWVEVKPKGGLADAYAPGANYNDKEFMEKLKGLQPGDSVTITFTTDFERHRIKTLRKNPVSPSKAGDKSRSGTPTKE
jgi:hypothetical protein